MGDSVEDLLAQMKAQYGDAQQPDASAVSQFEPPPPAQPPQPQSSPAPKLAGSIDDLLADIAGKPAPTQQSEHSQRPATPPAASLPATDRPPTISLPKNSPPKNKPSTDRLLDELKADYAERDRAETWKEQERLRAEALKQQAQLEQEQRRQAELQRQKRRAALQQAEEWLKRLDPRSGEAIWFEEFAAKYESRLEAAIDYLGLDG